MSDKIEIKVRNAAIYANGIYSKAKINIREVGKVG